LFIKLINKNNLMDNIISESELSYKLRCQLRETDINLERRICDYLESLFKVCEFKFPNQSWTKCIGHYLSFYNTQIIIEELPENKFQNVINSYIAIYSYFISKNPHEGDHVYFHLFIRLSKFPELFRIFLNFALLAKVKFEFFLNA
jgi:hypothetical protein